MLSEKICNASLWIVSISWILVFRLNYHRVSFWWGEAGRGGASRVLLQRFYDILFSYLNAHIETTATDTSLQKSQKRRAPLLLKRKALTTSFFDSSKIKSDGRKGSTSNTTGGLVFGQPLEKCLSNDNAFGTTIKQKGSDDSGGGTKLSRKSRASITSLDTQLPISSAISSDGNYVR